MKTIARADKTGITAEEKEKTRYAVAHNGKDVFHYVELSPYLTVATGLSNLVHYDSKDDMYSAFKDYALPKRAGAVGLLVGGSVNVAASKARP